MAIRNDADNADIDAYTDDLGFGPPPPRSTDGNRTHEDAERWQSGFSAGAAYSRDRIRAAVEALEADQANLAGCRLCSGGAVYGRHASECPLAKLMAEL